MNLRVINISLIWFNFGLYGFSHEIFTLEKKNGSVASNFLNSKIINLVDYYTAKDSNDLNILSS